MDATDAYIPPNNRDAECAVLGSMLIDADSIAEIREVLQSESFYFERHKWIYDAIIQLDDTNMPVDLLTVADILQKHAQLEDIGGEAYIIGLITIVPTSINAVHYAKIVEETGERRRMIRAASRVAELAHDETISAQEAVSTAQEEVFNLGQSLYRQSTVHIREPSRQVMDLVEERSASGGQIPGVPTGFNDMDHVLGGLHKSELVVVAGRPGMGKSSFQSSVCTIAGLKHKQNIAVFSLEMTSVQWALRMVSGIARIDSRDLRSGAVAEASWPAFYEAVGELSEANIYIDDTTSLTPSELRAKCRRLAGAYGLDLIMVDYLQLMGTKEHYTSRVQQVSYICKSLKDLAKELDVALVVSSQLSRAVEQRQDKRPQLSDLRDSGTIEEDADVVMFIYRDDYYTHDESERPNIAEVNVAKNRNGNTCVVDLFWNRAFTRFYNLERKKITF